MHYVSYTQKNQKVNYLATFKEVSLVMNRIIVCKSNSKATTADLDFYRQTTIFHAYNYRFYFHDIIIKSKHDCNLFLLSIVV